MYIQFIGSPLAGNEDVTRKRLEVIVRELGHEVRHLKNIGKQRTLTRLHDSLSSISVKL